MQYLGEQDTGEGEVKGEGIGGRREGTEGGTRRIKEEGEGGKNNDF